MSHDVFVSYSSKDKSIADSIVAAIEQNGIRCWYAPRDIKPGTDWGKSIIHAIQESKLFLLIFSENANHSQRVLDELNFSIAKEVMILPFRIENMEPQDAFMLHLSSRHWLDAYDPSWEAHIKKLIQTISANLDTLLPDDRIEVPGKIEQEQEEPNKKGLVKIISGVVIAAILLTGGWFGYDALFSSKTEELSTPTAISGNSPNQTPKATPFANLTPAAREADAGVDSAEDEMCRIVFQERASDSKYSNFVIVSADVDGTDSKRLTLSYDPSAIFPVWSPDGKKITYYSKVERSEAERFELWVMDANGTNKQSVAPQYTYNSDGCMQPVSWSPDSQQITFSSDHFGESDIFVINADGTGLEHLTNIETSDVNPIWSPDGEKIAYVSKTTEKTYISIMDRDGRNKQQLVENGWNPVWTPDSKQIAFMGLNGPLENGWYVGLINIDGGEPIILNPDLGLIASKNIFEDAETECNIGPSISPDGTRIAFVSNIDGDVDIYTANIDGSNVNQLTDQQGEDYKPSWSPDGSRIAYYSNQGKYCALNVLFSEKIFGSLPKTISRIENSWGFGVSWSPACK